MFGKMNGKGSDEMERKEKESPQTKDELVAPKEVAPKKGRQILPKEQKTKEPRKRKEYNCS